MAKLKTSPTDASVNDFISAVEPEQKKTDSFKVAKIMKEITGADPQMWGPSIIGFGDCHLVYESGRELDWFLCGFSPRKQALTLYLNSGYTRHEELMGKLGTYKTGKGCLYIKKLADVDEAVLRELIQSSVDLMREKYG